MSKKRFLDTKTLVMLGLMTALSVILARFCVIYITPSIRISFGNIPIIISGMLFGPIPGMLVGGVADLLGSAVLSGYGWYPPLTVTPMLYGLVAGIMRFMVRRRGATVINTFIMIFPACVLGSWGWTTYFLHILYGNPIGTLLSVRIPLYIGITVLEAIVVFLLIKSGAFKIFGLSSKGKIQADTPKSEECNNDLK